MFPKFCLVQKVTMFPGGSVTTLCLYIVLLIFWCRGTVTTVNSEIIAMFLLMRIMPLDVRRNNKNSHFNIFQ